MESHEIPIFSLRQFVSFHKRRQVRPSSTRGALSPGRPTPAGGELPRAPGFWSPHWWLVADPCWLNSTWRKRNLNVTPEHGKLGQRQLEFSWCSDFPPVSMLLNHSHSLPSCFDIRYWVYTQNLLPNSPSICHRPKGGASCSFFCLISSKSLLTVYPTMFDSWWNPFVWHKQYDFCLDVFCYWFDGMTSTLLPFLTHCYSCIFWLVKSQDCWLSTVRAPMLDGPRTCLMVATWFP